MQRKVSMRNSAGEEGLRERKRRETLKRIAETGLRLFIEKGYEGTTLEEIAEAAKISRRTFFYYFKSKEEVLLAYQGTGFTAALRPAMLEEPPDRPPLEAVRHCLLKLVSYYESEVSITVDRLLRSTEALRARKQASYVEMEDILFEAMCEIWPLPELRPGLRMVAMTSIMLLRFSIDNWRQGSGERSISECLANAFSDFDTEFPNVR
jgi:AcrR family transcriptional regulator